jgi:hypothetical protein
VLLIAGVYGTSFFLPVYLDLDGWEAFVSAGRLFARAVDTAELGHDLIGWAPNPLLWIGAGCLLARRDAAALALALAATAAACTWLELTGLSTGYYVWLTSMGLLAAAGYCCGLQPEEEEWF